MQEYNINVSEVEELQMIKDTTQLDQMFSRAKSTVAQGGIVILLRKNNDGTTYKFDELTTEPDLESYKESVFKYL
ncbi:MAG: hypothetical protein JWQ96_3477 [Segetibacter sp.]|jgi:hypothetical protein|nr:hypothetical protein [Segetibacter sp.]